MERDPESDLNFSVLTPEQAATLRKHLYNPPYLAKFIWLSFGRLNDKERRQAIPSVKNNTANFEYRHPDKLEQPIEEDEPQPTTYDEWIKIYPYAVSEFCTKNWIYERKRFVPNSGGSRRSLQKSRFLKRKSRKYKSIKKSKKRSFRNRGRH